MKYRTFVRTVGKCKAVGLYEINALDVVFPQNTAGISRRHCVLRANPVLTIEDCDPSVGTYVDGRKLTPYTSNRPVSGQKVALGSSKNSFEAM